MVYMVYMVLGWYVDEVFCWLRETYNTLFIHPHTHIHTRARTHALTHTHSLTVRASDLSESMKQIETQDRSFKLFSFSSLCLFFLVALIALSDV